MALKMYDVSIDATREVTQQDIDMFTATANAYGRLRMAIANTHSILMAEIERIRRGPALDLSGVQTEAGPTGPVGPVG